jgi:galactokinase
MALDESCGLGLAADDVGRSRLAAACVVAENEIAGAPTGGMDQAASLRCESGHALLLDCTDFSARQVPFDAAADGLEVLVVDTRVHHALVDGQYGSRRAECAQAVAVLGLGALGALPAADLDEALHRIARTVPDAMRADRIGRRVRHVVTEIERVRAAAALLEAGRLTGLGAVLDDSHTSLREDYEVSCAELDLACAAARAAGALGARMTGGGFGGSAIALVETSRAREVAAAVTQAFAGRGFTPPAFLRATPSEPAGRAGYGLTPHPAPWPATEP